MTPDHTKMANEALRQAANRSYEVSKTSIEKANLRQAKLRQGAELPEVVGYVQLNADGCDELVWDSTQMDDRCALVYERESAEYGDARDQAGYLRGLETALIKVTGLSVDVERCKQLQLTTQAWEEALDSAANAIEQLKVK